MLLNLSLPGVFSALWEILNMWPKSVDIGMEVSHENGLLQGELRICSCLCFLRKPLVDFVRSLLVRSRVEQAVLYFI